MTAAWIIAPIEEVGWSAGRSVAMELLRFVNLIFGAFCLLAGFVSLESRKRIRAAAGLCASAGALGLLAAWFAPIYGS